MTGIAPSFDPEEPVVCPECGSDDLLEDTNEGNVVCRSCGLILQNYFLDRSAEWRTFDDDEIGQDRCRVGPAVNNLLDETLGSRV